MEHSRPKGMVAARRCAAVLAVVAGLLLAQAPAYANIDGYRVTGTGGVGLKVRSDPYSTTAGVVAVLADNTAFSAVCAVRARDVYGNTVWHKIAAPVQGWIADYYTTTPGFNQYIPGELDCGAYNRAAARDWAYAHVGDAERFPASDCTWFVSQALWAGWLPRTATWTDSPVPSTDAIRADALKNAVISAGYATIREVTWSDNTAGGAQLGDVIAYDWNGAPDGIIDHLAIVTSLNAQGYPSVTQHSPARTDRYWSWDPAGNWIQYTHPGSRVYLIHIIR
jgi:hypothetical protein